jgi:hypothetical protein
VSRMSYGQEDAKEVQKEKQKVNEENYHVA